jgi:hypothetical protein
MEKKAGKKDSHETTKKTAEKAHSEPKAHKPAADKKEAHAEAKPAKKAPHKAAASEAKTEMPAKRCKIASCKREYRAKGYCKTHYRQWRHGAYGRARFKTCKDYGCTKQMALNRHGFCEEHFQNYYVKGMEQSKIAVEKPAAAKPEAKPAEKVA